jgi:hypothetical protein
MAAENAAENGLEDKAKFYTGDIRDHRNMGGTEL